MQKLIAAVYGEKAVDVLKETFESLTGEQRYDLMCNIFDVFQETFKDTKCTPEQENIILKSAYERGLEIIPGLKDKLDKELKEVLG